MNGQNKYNKSSKPRIIFEEHNVFIKREPSIDEELHPYPIIKSVKSEQNEATQNRNNDSQFPIKANAVDIQAKVLQTFAPATAKVTKHYTIATNGDDGNSLVPDLIENEFPIEMKTVKVEIENFEPITESIDIDTIKNENESKPCYVLLTRDLRCNYCDFKTKDLPKLLKHTNECSHKMSIAIETVNKVRDVNKVHVAYDHCEYQTKEESHLIPIGERRMQSKLVRKKRRPGKLKHTCYFCDAKFTTKAKRDEHIEEHCTRMMASHDHSSRCTHRWLQMSISHKTMLACNLCSHKCCSVSCLTNHARNRHGSRIEFICNTCGLSFKTKSQIIIHLKAGFCELAQTTEFTANDADFDFDMYRVKNTEKSSVHQMWVREPGYRCIECSFKCSQPISLKEHMKLHSKQPYVAMKQLKKTAKKYSCLHCKYKSLSEASLNEHMMKDHNDEKPYFCKLCDCKYSRMKDLVKHIKSHLLKRR